MQFKLDRTAYPEANGVSEQETAALNSDARAEFHGRGSSMVTPK